MGDKDEARRDRLKVALRENLRRRKIQARARPGEPAVPPAEERPGPTGQTD